MRALISLTNMSLRKAILQYTWVFKAANQLFEGYLPNIFYIKMEAFIAKYASRIKTAKALNQSIR